MKLSLLPLALATGALVAAAVVVALIFGASDGGGGGGGDFASYFQTLNTVQTDISSQYSAISSQYPQAFSDKQQTLDYLDASQQAWADGVDKLKALEPPETAAAEHDTLVRATDSVRGAFATLRTGAEGAADAAALQALLTNADTSAFDDYGTACQALQTLADTNNVTVTLPC